MSVKSSDSVSKLLPIYFGFIIMGFADIVGIATNYIKQDFGLSGAWANLVPSMVFLWFFIFSIPTGIWMNKTGRKSMVLISFLISLIAMAIPLLGYSFPMILLAFALLGIGNTILQVALPVLTRTVALNNFNTKLTLGYFFKSVMAISCPMLMLLLANEFGSWLLIFPLFSALSVVAIIWLYFTKIDEPKQSQEVASIWNVLSLLKDKYILSLFLIIVLIVGFEIGFLTTIPQYLIDNCGLTLEDGNYATMIYFIAKALGSFLGAMLLIRFSVKKFFILSMIVAVAGFGWLMLVTEQWSVYSAIFIVGLACASVVPMVVAKAIEVNPSKGNELSSLVMMGIFGGALFPPLMGFVSDYTNSQLVCLFIPLAALIYMLYTSIFVIKK